MAIKQITLDEASDEQIRDYAVNFLNLDLSAGEDIRSALLRAQSGLTDIFYQEPEEKIEAAEPHVEGGMQGSLGHGDPKWRIIIPVVETEDNSGKNDVVVGVNGRAWQIKRGVEVTVPHRVAVALKNAVANVVRHDNEGEVIETPTPRFSFTPVEQPSAAEIAAWDERTGAEFCA